LIYFEHITGKERRAIKLFAQASPRTAREADIADRRELQRNAAMPTLAINNFNIVCATLGGFITLFGLVSYLMKEKFYLSEACKLECAIMHLRKEAGERGMNC
jgi:hypothetical protein